ncbi:SCO family protein [Candidatus Mesenet endosymbiont of Agriotes lineatus]|uniref:SCO family protein n=1 Tax=Candidatus Mesenet endosymbiont of Agriotes lineatus TaxID=3077948 RepID=UPI0030CC99FA
MKAIKFFFHLITLIAIVFFGYSYFEKKEIFSMLKKTKATNEEITIGGEFSLKNQDNQLAKSSDFSGKYMLVLFGFSSCKSICPMELGIASEALVRLKEDAEKLQIIFITIDPKRDTVDKLKDYHQQFDHRIQMLTGSEEELSEVASRYKVYVNDTGEDIDHSGIMYFMGPDGKYVTHFTPDLNSNENQVDNLLTFIKKHIRR